MKVTRNLLVILLSIFLSVPVFAKSSHGGRSTSSHSHSSHASKKSHKAGSHDGQYVGGTRFVAQGRSLQEQENGRSLSGPETRNSKLREM